MTLKKFVNLLIGLLTFVFLSSIVFANHYDWDHFLTTFSAERNSWLNLEIPLYSHQICGGVTRIGDPQSFGLSPLFIFIIIFGPFIGSKLMIIFSFIIGFYFAYNICLLFIHDKLNSLVISALFITGNFYSWHLQSGHFTFILFYFSLGIIFYFIKCFNHSLRSIDTKILTMTVFTCLSGGQYPLVIYFLIPLSIGTIIYLIFNFQNFRKFYAYILSALLGIALSSYKTFGVLKYQRLNPRILTPGPADNNSILNLFFNATLPTWHNQHIFHITTNHWGIWEHSYFSLIIIISLFVALKSKFKISFINSFFYWMAISFIVFTLFSLGSFYKNAPFDIVNYFLNGSIRVPSRYFFGNYLIIFLFLLFAMNKKNYLFKDSSLVLILTLGIANSLLFSDKINLQTFNNLLHTPSTPFRSLTTATFVPLRDDRYSYMFKANEIGYASYNCYMPLSRKLAISDEFNFKKEFILKDIPILETSAPSCAQIEITQNKIIVPIKCTEKFCLNLNEPNPKYVEKYHLKISPKGGWCNH